MLPRTRLSSFSSSAFPEVLWRPPPPGKARLTLKFYKNPMSYTLYFIYYFMSVVASNCSTVSLHPGGRRGMGGGTLALSLSEHANLQRCIQVSPQPCVQSISRAGVREPKWMWRAQIKCQSGGVSHTLCSLLDSSLIRHFQALPSAPTTKCSLQKKNKKKHVFNVTKCNTATDWSAESERRSKNSPISLV